MGEAIKAYDETIRLNPNDAEVWNNKGVALGEQGKYDKAIEAYDEAVRLNPNYTDAWYGKSVAIKRLAALQKLKMPSPRPRSWVQADQASIANKRHRGGYKLVLSPLGSREASPSKPRSSKRGREFP